MDDSSLELIRTIRDTTSELSSNMCRLNGNVQSLHDRFDLVMHDIDARMVAQSRELDLVSRQIERWRAQVGLVVGVATFLGFSGLASLVAYLAKGG